ncbi:CU044_5270 family protein [Amycolatopsis sp. NPDC051045]|uniref:CU044_5270 family protein n=1 Tax=Amycolatopsis sp. NPDC051045 TaxID=3156922 RepID=UPI0034133BD2
MTENHDKAAVHELWLADDELDRALRELRADVQPDDQAVCRGRTIVLAAAEDLQHPEPVAGGSARRRSLRSWIAVAAAVTLLTGGILVAQTIGDDPGHAAVADTLGKAADQVATGARDDVVGAGRYRYIETHAWWEAGSPGGSVWRENLHQTWVPADQRQEWLQRRAVIATRPSIPASGEEAGVRSGGREEESESRALCGDFFAGEEGRKPCEGMLAGWQVPTPQWQAGLPKNPEDLLQRLRTDAPDNSRGDMELLVYASDALRTGLLEAEVRAALYKALAKLPELKVVDQAANLDGRIGVALGLDDGHTREEIIIDPATGQFIGERSVLTEARGGHPEGTVVESTSVRTVVVDALGALPAG